MQDAVKTLTMIPFLLVKIFNTPTELKLTQKDNDEYKQTHNTPYIGENHFTTAIIFLPTPLHQLSKVTRACVQIIQWRIDIMLWWARALGLTIPQPQQNKVHY